ncbi:hypothetical protein Syncc8109_0178 [Synechococcus sp. WH 8109]|nr:hypothetical protein Syncc8109_0178 [Synechococcus sp. WH 8109]
MRIRCLIGLLAFWDPVCLVASFLNVFGDFLGFFLNAGIA